MIATRFAPLVLSIALGLSSGLAAADDATARNNGCMACHSVDKKLVGPAYKAVAEKYKGDAKAAGKLAAKVKAGGKGVWGPVPMPAQTNISDDDLKKVIAWVLNQ
jgi:cytochrome c